MENGTASVGSRGDISKANGIVDASTKDVSDKIVDESNFFQMLSLKLLTLTTIITFLWSGLTINLLQLINYLITRNINFHLYTRINYYLMYSAWAQIVTLFDWFFRSTYRVWHAKKEQEGEIFKDHNIFLANHGYELDWIAAWLVTDKYGHLASCKAMLKSDLKYLPVVGWSWAMSDQLFLDRNWEKDKHKFGSSIDVLLKYRPMVATFFCEGTRFTRKKLQQSLQFAAERNLEAPKYHLIPRTKGFVTVMRHVKQRMREDPSLKVYIYNAQVAFEDRGAMNVADILKRGLRPIGHMYFEKITLDQVPDDDEGCAKWLHGLFLKKDNLQEYFNQHQCFPGHEDHRFISYRPRLITFANWLFWTLYTAVPIFYLFMRLYISFGAFYVSLALSAFFMLSYAYLTWIMFQADVGDECARTNKREN